MNCKYEILHWYELNSLNYEMNCKYEILHWYELKSLNYEINGLNSCLIKQWNDRIRVESLNE